jgi:hypothetical protein
MSCAGGGIYAVKVVEFPWCSDTLKTRQSFGRLTQILAEPIELQSSDPYVDPDVALSGSQRHRGDTEKT